MAIGIDVRTYPRDAPIRTTFESDVTKLTPRRWKKQLDAGVTARRDEVLRRILTT